jgi:hypothetical protein
MKRNKCWRARWGSFLMGVCIGLLIVTPVLATPPGGLESTGIERQAAARLFDRVAHQPDDCAMRFRSAIQGG